MSIRAIIVVVLAVTCGASAAMGVSRLQQRAPAPGKVETTPIVVAKTDVPRGSMVTADMLETREWPKDYVPDKALTQIDDALGRAAIVPLVANELVLDGKLASRDSGRGLAALVPKGMRAYTIHTARAAANVAGFILPGNHVDVLMSLKSNQNDETGGGSTTTLLQAVEILAVAQRLDAPAENKVDPADLGSVTLLVTPDQAALLDLGQSAGALTLSLRNPEDTAAADTRPALLAEIRFHQEKPAPEPLASAPTEAKDEEPQTVEIRTLRGNHSGRVLVTVGP